MFWNKISNLYYTIQLEVALNTDKQTSIETKETLQTCYKKPKPKNLCLQEKEPIRKSTITIEQAP